MQSKDNSDLDENGEIEGLGGFQLQWGDVQRALVEVQPAFGSTGQFLTTGQFTAPPTSTSSSSSSSSSSLDSLEGAEAGEASTRGERKAVSSMHKEGAMGRARQGFLHSSAASSGAIFVDS